MLPVFDANARKYQYLKMKPPNAIYLMKIKKKGKDSLQFNRKTSCHVPQTVLHHAGHYKNTPVFLSQVSIASGFGFCRESRSFDIQTTFLLPVTGCEFIYYGLECLLPGGLVRKDLGLLNMQGGLPRCKGIRHHRGVCLRSCIRG